MPPNTATFRSLNSTNRRATRAASLTMPLFKNLPTASAARAFCRPCLVRPLTENGFEIVAGARRYRAAQMAEQETVPVRIRHMTDAEVIEAQLVENLIRAEIHPMEEAEGFARLLALEEPKYSIEQIGARWANRPSFVASRLKLVDLVPAAVEAFYANEIGVGHALLLAKMPADQQQQALSACFKEVYNSGSQKPARILLPVRNLQFWIESNVLLVLKDAPFDKRDAQLVPTAGSCADCPKRTGHNKLLFGDDLGKQGDRCTDPSCYQCQTRGARGKDRCRQARACADQHGLRRAEGRQPGIAAQQVHRDPRRQAEVQRRGKAPGVQGVQVRHRGHRHRRQRHWHHP